jgi:hypothetical protein
VVVVVVTRRTTNSNNLYLQLQTRKKFKFE